MSAKNRQKDTFINFLYRFRFLLLTIASVVLHCLAVLSRSTDIVSFDALLVLVFAFASDGLLIFYAVVKLATRIKATWRKTLLCLASAFVYYFIIVLFVALDDQVGLLGSTHTFEGYLGYVNKHIFENTNKMDLFDAFPLCYFSVCAILILLDGILDSIFNCIDKVISWLRDLLFDDYDSFDDEYDYYDDEEDEEDNEEDNEETLSKRAQELLESLSPKNKEKLETELLELYPVTPDNQTEYAQIMSNDKDAYTLYKQFRFDDYLDRASYVYKKVSLGDSYLWIVSLKNGPAIGTIELYAARPTQFDMDVNIHERYLNEGYMQEAIQKTVNFLFEHSDAKKITAKLTGNCSEKRRLLESLGFACDGTIKNFFYYMEEYHDCHIYSLYRPDLPEPAEPAEPAEVTEPAETVEVAEATETIEAAEAQHKEQA